jgi:MFS family permease
LPTSIYLTVGAVMSQGALIVGGGAVALAELASGPLGVAPWRLTFIIVALPGVVLAVFFAKLVAEPPRGDAGKRTGDRISLMAATRHLFGHAGIYFGMFLGVGSMATVVIIMIAWIPTMLIREHGLSPAQAGLAYGLPALVGAIGGTMSVPLLLKRLGSCSRARALVIAAIVGMATIPAVTLTVGSESLPLVMIGIGIAVAGICGSSVLPPLLVQAVTPPRFRARLVAAYLTIMTLLSQGLGPSLVATLAAHSPGTALSFNIARAIWRMLGMAFIFVAVAMASTRRGTGQNVPVDDGT